MQTQLTQEKLLHRRLSLFPVTTRLANAGGRAQLTIAGLSLTELAKRFGTPLYLYDRATLDSAVQDYRQALMDHYPYQAGLTYAGKAFLCVAMAQWASQQSLWLDCTGAGELNVAAAAGVPRRQVLVHGVNKSQADLSAALSQAGTIVVDNLEELARLEKMAELKRGPLPDLWLRLRPGQAVETHSFRQTGQEDSKFGMSPDEISQAAGICRGKGLPLTGLHFHQGSHFHDPSPVAPAMEAACDILLNLRNESGWYPQVICPGGGWGVAYHEDEGASPATGDYVRFVSESLMAACQARGLPLPRLQLEPGRSLVARAGVALYRVGAVKRAGRRRWLLLDGGMADNPRPALYGARYSALTVEEPGRPIAGTAWLAGPYCESGDVLIEDLPMPEVAVGELVAIPVSGAYQLSMGSNYNGARKPAVVWLEEGAAQLIQQRETPEDLVRRDLPLPSKRKNG